MVAIRHARDAAVAGISLNEYAKDHPELKQSLEKFGNLKH
jgi:ribulose-bisphosphate carboxylase large chain